jgi:hypothetical protein
MFIGEPPAFIRPGRAAHGRRGPASADSNHAPMADGVQGLSAADAASRRSGAPEAF